MFNSPRKRLAATAGVVGVALVALWANLWRPFWFDESLTVMEYVLLEDISSIYFQYTIPNNHIAYNIILSVFEDLFCGLGLLPPDARLRVPSVIFAISSILVLCIFWRRRFGFAPLLAAALSMILSMPFLIYGSAVRGYMLSFLLVAVGLELAMRISERGGTGLYLGYFSVALLAVGSIPTNIICFGGIFLVAVSMERLPLSSGRLLRISSLACLPILAFLIFYIPILGRFLKTVSIREGWESGVFAAWHFYASFAACFAAAILFSIPGLWHDLKRRPAATLALLIPATVLPLAFFLVRNPSPFPRAFFPYFPVILFIVVLFLQRSLAMLREMPKTESSMQNSKRSHLDGKRSNALPYMFLIFAIFIAAYVQSNLKDQISGICGGRCGQDDFFNPYYMKENFRPLQTTVKLAALRELSQRKVLIDAALDYPSIIFYGRLVGIPESDILFDGPYKKLDSLGDLAEIYIISGSPDMVGRLKGRFPLREIKEEADIGYYRIFSADVMQQRF